MHHGFRDVATLVVGDVVAGVRQDLRKTADDVQGRAYFVADILDEFRLHLIGLEHPVIGYLHLPPMTTSALHDVNQRGNEQQQQADDDDHAIEHDAALLAAHLIHLQLVLDALHRTRQEDAVDGIGLCCSFLQRFESFLPTPSLRIDLCLGLEWIICYFCSHPYSLIGLSVIGQPPDFQLPSMYRRKALGGALLVGLVALDETLHVT